MTKPMLQTLRQSWLYFTLLFLFFSICLISSLKEIAMNKIFPDCQSNWVLEHPSQPLYQLSYSNIVTHKMEIYQFK